METNIKTECNPHLEYWRGFYGGMVTGGLICFVLVTMVTFVK